MFDTRPMEKVSSLMILLVIPAFALSPALLLTVLGFLAWDSSGVLVSLLGTACCTAVVGLLLGVALLWFMRWTRTGKAGPFLAEVADDVGGEVQLATLVWSLTSPRLTGTLDGHPYRLTLRRQAGFLSPATVGNRLALFGWSFDLWMAAPIGVKVGFSPQGMAEGGLSLLGIGGPGEDFDGVKVFANRTERGAAIVHDPTAQVAARTAVNYGQNGCLVRVGPDALLVTHILHEGVTPAQTVAFVRAAAALCQAAGNK